MIPRETDVFHKRYMQDKAVVDISAELQVSNVRIYGLIGQLKLSMRNLLKKILNTYRVNVIKMI